MTSVNIDYSHEINRDLHTLDGALEALSLIFQENCPKSILDIGCGTGTWLRAALSLGAERARGVEGLDLREEVLFISKSLIVQHDLNEPLHLGESFELVLCLEAAEHIEPGNADTLIDSIARHGDRILFSAAAPNQGGTHHVNCQWPEYWQDKFNARGYVCSDSVRWQIWNARKTEPWYRQNLMNAVKSDVAGTEPRIKPVIHPDALPCFSASFLPAHVKLIENGGLPWHWYVPAVTRALRAKLRQRGQRRREISSSDEAPGVIDRGAVERQIERPGNPRLEE
jgi:SAM-dependent methyltransferase